MDLSTPDGATSRFARERVRAPVGRGMRARSSGVGPAAAAGVDSSPTGLVSCDISAEASPQGVVAPSPSARVAIFADVVELRSGRSSAPGCGGVRGACKGFSKSSRRRLIHKLAQVRGAGLVAYFVTLTYPAEFSRDWKRWKRDFKVWRDRLMGRFPSVVGGCWRVEFQKRGAPHFHVLLWVKDRLPPTFKLWLSHSWYNIVGSEDEKHLRAGTNAQELDCRRAVRLYVSKYVGKLTPAVDNETGEIMQPDGWGRNWALFGDLDMSPVVEMELEQTEYVMLRRLIRSWLKSRGSLRYADYLRRAEVVQALGLGVESVEGEECTVWRMLRVATGCSDP